MRKGRKEEFAAFQWTGEIPDPQDEATYERSRIDHRLGGEGHHKTLREFYRELILLRKDHPVLSRLSKDDMEVTAFEKEKVLFLRRWWGMAQTAAFFHFGSAPASLAFSLV